MKALLIDCPQKEDEHPHLFRQIRSAGNCEFLHASGTDDIFGILGHQRIEVVVLYRRQLRTRDKQLLTLISNNYPNIVVIVNIRPTSGEEHTYLGQGVYLSEIQTL